MVRIRLRRTGSRNAPAYRVVVADARAPRDGRFIENLGHYNPLTDPAEVVIDKDRALYWLGVGAQPSETARSLLRQEGILQAFEEAKSRAHETPSE
ncbi:MAG TPA: 30S ribosomal protein S16 [Armatimonadota bacterium]|nr:30S ribosomal protein S16 [Armatimonadota bacterium]HQK95660.1 30S ribosomal protein S16 [Armatimonadota bacterium]